MMLLLIVNVGMHPGASTSLRKYMSQRRLHRGTALQTSHGRLIGIGE
ncbi:MAG: hypothetical protein J6C86_09345 [Bacteroidaceae bacterium]|nr:hypothetical protein [Bacteroidaceae bacterium]